MDGIEDSDRRAPAAVVALLALAALAAGCGSDVYFCSDPDGDPPGCEICSNDSDDDLDGDVDCEDRDCRDAAVCARSDADRPAGRAGPGEGGHTSRAG